MSIEESNRLIAEFMGAELDGYDWHITGREWTVSNKRYPGNLQYHTSWDWLMPVIEKISQEPLIGAETARDVCYPVTFGMPHTDDTVMFRFCGFCLHHGSTLIEAAYSAVKEFVIYQREQPQPEGKAKEGV